MWFSHTWFWILVKELLGEVVFSSIDMAAGLGLKANCYLKQID